MKDILLVFGLDLSYPSKQRLKHEKCTTYILPTSPVFQKKKIASLGQITIKASIKAIENPSNCLCYPSTKPAHRAALPCELAIVPAYQRSLYKTWIIPEYITSRKSAKGKPLHVIWNAPQSPTSLPYSLRTQNRPITKSHITP